MDALDYWKECISDAAEECELSLTSEQLDILAGAVDNGHEHFSMAFGYDVADRNYQSEEAIELKRLKSEQEKHETWIRSTEPCKYCTTTGCVRDGWGRDATCTACNGKGRV